MWKKEKNPMHDNFIFFDPENGFFGPKMTTHNVCFSVGWVGGGTLVYGFSYGKGKGKKNYSIENEFSNNL